MKIFVRVKPRARQNKIEKLGDNSYFVQTTAPPEQGKANGSVAKLLAEYFDVTRTQVELIRGGTSREKIFVIHES